MIAEGQGNELNAMLEKFVPMKPEQVPKFQIVTPNLIAFDKAMGKPVGEVSLPRNATAAPMTYMLKGKQFLVVAPGGANLPAELIAFTL
jgi:quinoprotein glucose dehydrogenase